MGLLDYFRAMGRGLMFWRAPPPLNTQARLTLFCAQQAAFMAQSNLYGYLRTRAGLQHFNLFRDDAFLALLRPARSKLALICLQDVTLYSVACLVKQGLGDDQANKLAQQIFNAGLDVWQDTTLADDDIENAQMRFADRIKNTAWAMHATPDAFEASTQGLIELAPIVDELKSYDTEIVCNSMRFKWMGVRAELVKRLDTVSLLASLG